MTRPAVTGLNHITLSVSRLDRSIAFYVGLLGFVLRADWPEGAYLEAGPLWLCLALEPERSLAAQEDYSHIAFGVVPEDFDVMADQIRSSAPAWKDNHSEGASLYFLDPDGHRLEIHCGTLQTRLEHYRRTGRPGIRFAGS